MANMNLKRPPHSPQGRQQQYSERHLSLLDIVMDSYVQWRDESRGVHEAYRRWQLASREERDIAFERYLVALDREERAAHGYRRVVEETDAS
jgi:hypothetical protein